MVDLMEIKEIKIWDIGIKLKNDYDMESVYLKTKQRINNDVNEDTKFFRIDEKIRIVDNYRNILTVNVTRKSINHTKGIASSPLNIIPSNKKEFDKAKKQVVKYLDEL
jgi:hypothetical protein